MERYGAVVGLDWASEKHDFSVRIGGKAPEAGVFPHRAEAIRDWALDLHRRAKGQVAVCLEQNRGGLFNALSEYPFLTLFPVNPLTVKRYRQAFSVGGAKDDRGDAELQRELLEKHSEELKAAPSLDEVTCELKLSVEGRRAVVDERTRVINQLRACLKGYFPQFLGVFADLTSKVVSGFLLSWSSLEAVQAEKNSKLKEFFFEARSYSQSRMEMRIAHFKTAIPLTTNRAIIRASVLRVRSLCKQLQALHSSIDEFESRIEELLALHPDAELFASFPVVGNIHRARLISAFGTDRARFSSALDIQVYAGIAPVKDQSGQKQVIRARKACSHFLRQTFTEWAGATIQASSWAKGIYSKARAKGKSHHVAVRALAYKWIRILFACWKSGSPYSEELHFKNIASKS